MAQAVSAGDIVTVNAVACAVPSLDNRRVMKGTPALVLEMPGRFPRLAFVIGKRHGQTLPSAGGIVVNQQPMTVAQAHRVQTRPGMRQFRDAHGPPTDAPIA